VFEHGIAYYCADTPRFDAHIFYRLRFEPLVESARRGTVDRKRRIDADRDAWQHEGCDQAIAAAEVQHRWRVSLGTERGNFRGPPDAERRAEFLQQRLKFAGGKMQTHGGVPHVSLFI
jgi:hypothetical protein